ncbi:MAG: aminopeptidase P N-terminal domain-containing protein [Pseudomonadota bacterium]
MRPEVYANRRRQVMSMAGQDAIVILPSAPLRIRSRDTAYPFRQSSDFFYLTGYTEPEAVLVLVPGRDQGEILLFCRDRDPEKERWDGPRAGIDGAREQFGMDDAFPIDDIDEILPSLLGDRTRVFHTLGQDPDFDQRLIQWVNQVRSHVPRSGTNPGEFISLDHHLHELRLFKNRDEIQAVARSAKLAATAHLRAMRACRPGMMEYELAAELLHEFHRANALPAYEPIVGSGANACIMHYITNADRIGSDDLVLIDAGAELEGYASDITRTFPASGRFTGEQRAIYEIVLAAQTAAIEIIRPGAAWDAPHEAAAQTITEGLCDLGLLHGDPHECYAEEDYREFFPHKTGHWLGLDVHDVGDYRVDGHSRELEKGMVFTVEPGVYIPPDADVDERWRGIGVRIEDDIAVTAEGCRNLSSDVPRTVDDIERWMAA